MRRVVRAVVATGGRRSVSKTRPNYNTTTTRVSFFRCVGRGRTKRFSSNFNEVSRFKGFKERSFASATAYGTGISLITGAFGAMAGLGGSIIGTPMLTRFMGLVQQQANGTMLPSVLITAIVATFTYYFHGNTSHTRTGNSTSDSSPTHPARSTPDFYTAALLATTSSLATPLSVRFANRIPPTILSNLLGFFILAVSPLVLLRRQTPSSVSPLPLTSQPDVSIFPSLPNSHNSLSCQSPEKFCMIAATGVGAGVLAGLFGIGGGIMMIPVLSMFETQQEAVTTSLLAMMAPSAVGVVSHWRLGNVYWKVLPGMFIGGAVGAHVGGLLSTKMSDNEQRYTFTALLILAALASFRKGRTLKTSPKP